MRHLTAAHKRKMENHRLAAAPVKVAWARPTRAVKKNNLYGLRLSGYN